MILNVYNMNVRVIMQISLIAAAGVMHNVHKYKFGFDKREK